MRPVRDRPFEPRVDTEPKQCSIDAAVINDLPSPVDDVAEHRVALRRPGRVRLLIVADGRDQPLRYEIVADVRMSLLKCGAVRDVVTRESSTDDVAVVAHRVSRYPSDRQLC